MELRTRLQELFAEILLQIFRPPLKPGEFRLAAVTAEYLFVSEAMTASKAITLYSLDLYNKNE